MEIILGILFILVYIVLIPIYVVFYSFYIIFTDWTIAGILNPVFIIGILYLIIIYCAIKKCIIVLKHKLWK